MHIPSGSSHSSSCQANPDWNEADAHAEDIVFALHNYIPFGSVTVNLRRDPDGFLVAWPVRDEWQEANNSLRPVLLGQCEPFESPLRTLLCGKAIRVFGRRHQQDDGKGTFRVYGKIYGQNV